MNLDGVVSVRWEETPATEICPGIRKRVLWTGPGGAEAQMLEIEPGAVFHKLDVHAAGPEEIFVISGTFGDGVHEYPAGSFIHNPAGSSHVPQSRDGCVIFIFAPNG
ncbi:MAG TPA: cupin domain-containing protein [Thermoanaerobaculia bacterium]|nr:cupin domain-containing protein [Thermoanaerobaculia bacterium]